MRGLILFKGSLMKRLIWPYVGLLAFLISCSLKGFNDSGPIAYQTEILAAYAIPKTVAPGVQPNLCALLLIVPTTSINFIGSYLMGLLLGVEKYINWYRNVCYFEQSN